MGSAHKKTGSVTPYDKATPDRQKELEREAVIANVVAGNKRKVCEETFEEYNTRGTQKHFCPFCKMTLTRVCAQKKCKDLRDGQTVMAEREDAEPEHSADDNEPEKRMTNVMTNVSCPP